MHSLPTTLLRACTPGLALLVATLVGMAQNAPLKTLTTAAEVRSLTQTEAGRQFPVRLRGVVMDEAGESPGQTGFGIVLQDHTQGIYLEGPAAIVRPFRIGDLVEVEGVTDPGGFAPFARITGARKLGVTDVPPPRRVTFEELISGELDAQWVEITGIVRHSVGTTRAHLHLATGGELLTVVIEHLTNTAPLVDAKIRLHGIAFNQHNINRQLVSPIIHVPRGVALEVLTPAQPDPFERPPVSVASLLQFAPQGTYGHRVHVRGTVIHHMPGEFLWLRDADRGLRVQTAQTNHAPVGTTVSVVGFPNRGEYTPILENGLFQLISPGPTPEPHVVATTTGAIEHDADLITFDAVLVETKPIAREGRLLIEYLFDWGGEKVSAVLNVPRGAPLPEQFEPGSILQLTGICAVAHDESAPVTGVWRPQGFQLLLRSPADLVLVQAPPWWTLERIVWLFAGVAALSLMAVGAALWVSRKHLREQAARRALAEAEFAAILKERNRMAREIHDTLAQGLSAISMQLELARRKVIEAPDTLHHTLETAHALVRQSLNEARNSIWNMRSQALETGDLKAALESVLHHLTDGTGVVGKLECTGHPRRLSPLVENHLLRIGQEAITNAAKHAAARNIAVHLEFTDRQVRLRVHDDGHGFDASRQNPPAKSFGLVGMRERAEQMHGKLTVESKPDAGTTVTVTLPTPN